MADYFKNIYVLFKYNPIARFLDLFGPALSLYNSKNKIDLTNKPQNLNVTLAPIFYAPFDSYKKAGEKFYNAVDKLIRKKSINFDLVHSHFTWPTGYVGMKLKEKYNVPFIVTAHGYDIYHLPFKDKDWTEKIRSILNSADYVITVSNSNLEYIQKLKVNTKVIILPNRFKKDSFYMRNQTECRKLLCLPVDRKIILSVGNSQK